MRVLHIYKDIYPPVAGGIETHIDTLRRTLPDIRSDVIVCSRTRQTTVRSTTLGTEVLVGEFGRVISVPIAPTFPFHLGTRLADVIHLHMPNPTGEISLLLTQRGRPLVVTYHSDVVRQQTLMPLYRPVVNACLRRADAIIVSTQRLRDTSPALASWRDKTKVIPYGLDTDRFDPALVSAADREAIRARFGSPLIVSTGRLVYYKGYEYLIRAARNLDASVLILGSGPLEQRLGRLAAGLPRFHLLGQVTESDLIAMVASADCFVLPSSHRAESFGIATLEAQALRVPAVVTEVGTGTTETVEDGRTGLVIPPRDPRAIAEACQWILDHPQEAAGMGDAARRRVIDHYSAVTVAARVREVYERVSGHRALAGTGDSRPRARLARVS
jgi:glycosyltransferase involved in cell wall biosynthesis